MRLENAKRELLYTNRTIAYIVIGYSTVQKFSRDFKEYMGFAPTNFKKKFR